MKYIYKIDIVIIIVFSESFSRGKKPKFSPSAIAQN